MNGSLRVLRLTLVAAVCLLVFSPLGAQLQPLEEDQGVTGFGLALRKLSSAGSVLYITAHPDDENNSLLVKLSRGLGLRVGLLTLTRGDGGQNEIGQELFQAIGVLRSEELLAAHRFDDVEQFFTRAYEFGYSFSVEESFQKWGREETLKDTVRVIRAFRPQVILSMSPEGSGGGQHHQASSRLAADAFRAAGDPTRFPELLAQENLRPWQPQRLFQSARFRRREAPKPEGPRYSIELSEYDPFLGETYAEFGMRARSQHRCQGMNVLPRIRSSQARYLLADATVPSPAASDNLFVGLDTSLRVIARFEPALEARLDELGSRLEAAREAFSTSRYESAVAEVMAGLQLVRRAKAESGNAEARFLLARKEKQFLKAAAKGHFIRFEAFSSETKDGTVVAGEKFKTALRFRASSKGFSNPRLELAAPPNWKITQIETEGEFANFEIEVPANAPPSQPFWFRSDTGVDRYNVAEGFEGMSGMQPFAPPPLIARLSYTSSGVEAFVEEPVQFRWYDAASAKDRRMEIKVVPAISLSLTPEVAVVRAGQPGAKQLTVLLRNHRTKPAEAVVRLQLPDGWRAEPAQRTVKFRSENQRIQARFQIHAPEGVGEGPYRIFATAESEGNRFDEGFQTIAYHHIQTRHLYRTASATVEVLNLELPETLRVGYIEGVGDAVAEATREMGIDVSSIEAGDLAEGDLSAFDVIVTGVRAYLNRRDLVAFNSRLLDYVKQGGVLVVQWNKYEFTRQQFTPYPIKIGRPADRVSVEEAPVRILQPAHPVFLHPNRISSDDWNGWVQERATYMWGEWDPRFEPLIEMEDPWPNNEGPKQGALLSASYGKGTYFYAGLAFFRQLPAGVPGAYRLWANILSLGESESGK